MKPTFRRSWLMAATAMAAPAPKGSSRSPNSQRQAGLRRLKSFCFDDLEIEASERG